jgi:hypothetical protein
VSPAAHFRYRDVLAKVMPMIASHPQAEATPFADHVLTETPLDGLDTADRRNDDRVPPVIPARAEVRRLGIWSGPDFGEELIDLSKGGVKVRLGLAVKRGERFDVTLWGPRGEWCGRFQAIARWAERVGPAQSLVGLQLGRAIPRQAVVALTTARGTASGQ